MARIEIKDLKRSKHLTRKEIAKVFGGSTSYYLQINPSHPELKNQLLKGYDTVTLEGSQLISNLYQSDPDRDPENEMGHGT